MGSGTRGADGKGRGIPFACLDLVEAAHRDRIWPIAVCHMELAGHLDAGRLAQAVGRAASLIPELLCGCDFGHYRFVDVGRIASDAVRVGAPAATDLQPDLAAGPQLRVFLEAAPNGPARTRATVVASHVLADGNGFLQLLYLLAALYSGEEPRYRENVRDIGPLLAAAFSLPRIPNEHIVRDGRRERAAPPEPLRPLPPDGAALRPVRCTKRLSADCLAALHARAHRAGATLNDAFMAAYARTVARRLGTNAAVLPCPADLRRFDPSFAERHLTVANMTGNYREVRIATPPDAPFGTVLADAHRAMARQKAGLRCLDGVRVLHRAHGKVPVRLLTALVRAGYHTAPVSFSNIGAVDCKRLCFAGCTVEECYLTGTYRLPPDFQLTVSTFQGVCTLACTLLGTPEDERRGQALLDEVAGELAGWAVD